MANPSVLGLGSAAPAKLPGSTSALDEIAALPAPAATAASAAPVTAIGGLAPATATTPIAAGTAAVPIPSATSLPTGLTPTGAAAPVGTGTRTGTVTPTTGVVTPTAAPVGTPTPDAQVSQPYGVNSGGDFETTSLAGAMNNRAYELGGYTDFAGNLSAVMQNTANAGSNAAQQVGYGTQAASNQIGGNAQAVGAQANTDQRQFGASTAQYGRDMASGIQTLGSGLTTTGQEMAGLANGVTGRAAPTLDTAAQNESLRMAGDTSGVLGGAGMGLLAAGQSAQGRAAPTLDANAQNAALATAAGATNQLGQTGSTMGQLALQAGGRATPTASYDAANNVLGSSLGTAGKLGTTAEQATAAAQAAGQRGAIGADYSGSRSALDQLAGLESGPGQSGAEALLRQGAGMAAQQALMQGHSGRGFGANAQATSEALRQNAATMGNVENQAAQLRAQEYAQRQQRAASNLTTQAGLLSGQSQAEQAAALQVRSQNDAAQAALYGVGNQANATQGGLQQAASGQLSAQQQAEQAAALQSRAQNDQSQNALLAGQAAAQQNAAALGQSQAQQYGQQAALNQAAALQTTGQNDSALAALSGLGTQAIAQTAGIQQANAAQQGQQAALNQAAQIQATGQNDAAAEAYRQLQLQGLQGGVAAQEAAGQLGVAGMTAGAGIINQGANTAIAGDQLAANANNQAGQLAMNGVLQGTQLQQNALTSTGQIAQIASGMTQAQIDAQLQQYAIREGVGVQTRAQNIGLLGAGIGAAGTIATAAASSDKRAKTKIKSATPEELMLSPGDSLLQSRPEPSALDQLDALQTDGRAGYMTGEEMDADPYGLGYRVPNASAKKPLPTAAEANQAASNAAYQQSSQQTAALGQQAEAAGQQKDATIGGVSGIAGGVIGGAVAGPVGAAIGGIGGRLAGTALSKAFRKSDVRAKTDIEPATESELVPDYAGRGPMYAGGGKTGLDVQGPGGPAFDKAMGQQAYAEGADGRRNAALATGYFSHLPEMLRAGSGPPPSLMPARRRREYGPILTSDVSEKTDISPEEESRFRDWARANNIRDVDHPDSHYDYRGFWKDQGGPSVRGGVDHFPDTYKQHGHPTFSTESRYSTGRGDGGNWLGDDYIPGVPQGPAATAGVRSRPVDNNALDAAQDTDLRAAKGYSYEYKDPDAPGAAPGRQVGPMAQDLQRTSARDAVVKGRDGKLGVDTGRLSLRNTAAISQQQRELDELRELIAELGAGLPTTSGFERRNSY